MHMTQHLNSNLNAVCIKLTDCYQQGDIVHQVGLAFCRYNYTVYQDTEHGRQKLVRDSVETTVSVLDKVRL